MVAAPMPHSLTATELEDYQTSIRRYLGSRVCDLQLESHDGGIVLYGWSRSYYGKQLAQHIAQTMTGMPIIANNIEVV